MRAVELRFGFGETGLTVGACGAVVSTSHAYVMVDALGFLLPTFGMTPLTLKVLLPTRAVGVAVPLVPTPHEVNFAPFSEHVNVSEFGAVHANEAVVDPVGFEGTVVKVGEGERGGGAAAAGTASAPTMAVATIATNDARRAI